MMRKKILKLIFGLSISVFTIVILLFCLILNPSLLYAHHTKVLNHNVYHDQALSSDLENHIKSSIKLIETSELYNKNLSFNICLDHGSVLPQIMNTIQGPAYGWGFFNHIVLRGQINDKQNTISIHHYKWDLSQLMAHELTHCLQINTFGFWSSNPIADHAEWKWEGYPEYVARQDISQVDLKQNLDLYKNTFFNKDWAIEFKNGTIAPKSYYKHWLLVKYCLDIKKMTYKALIEDKTIHIEDLEKDMWNWYASQK